MNVKNKGIATEGDCCGVSHYCLVLNNENGTYLTLGMGAFFIPWGAFWLVSTILYQLILLLALTYPVGEVGPDGAFL